MDQESVVTTEIGQVVVGGQTTQVRANPNRNAGFYMYYRCPNGEIQYAPADVSHRSNFSEEGRQPLRQYGAFEWNWITARHPFDQLFLNGGAKEFTVEQIILMGWHKTPPTVTNNLGALVPVKFPQLDGVDIPDFSCDYCDHGVYTKEGRANHMKVAHKEELEAERMSGAIASGLSGTTNSKRPKAGAE